MKGKSHLRHYWPVTLTLTAMIATLSGCDRPAELACDTPDAVSSLEKYLSAGQDVTTEHPPLIARFAGQGDADGTLSVREIKETSRNAAAEVLTCAAIVNYAPGSLYGKTLSADIEYTVARHPDGIMTQLIRTGEHISLTTNSSEAGQPKLAMEKLPADKNEEQASPALHDAAALPDDRFTAITPEDLLYIFAAQSGQRITDAEKLNLFSVQWLQEKDAEARDALAEKELLRINDRLQQYQNLRDIRFDVNAPQAASGTLSASARYDISFDYSAERQSFAVSGDFCDTPPVEWRTAVRGVQLMLARVVNTCDVRVPEKDAAVVSATLSNADSVQVSSSVFARILDVEPVTNRILIAVLRQQAQVTTKTTGQPDNILLAEFR